MSVTFFAHGISRAKFKTWIFFKKKKKRHHLHEIEMRAKRMKKIVVDLAIGWVTKYTNE